MQRIHGKPCGVGLGSLAGTADFGRSNDKQSIIMDIILLDEIRQRFGVHRNTVRNWRKNGMPVHRIGRSVFVVEHEFLEWTKGTAQSTGITDLSSLLDDVETTVRR